MIKIGQQIGTFNTILIIFFTATVGIYYAKVEGLNTVKAGMINLYKNNLRNDADIIDAEIIEEKKEKDEL